MSEYEELKKRHLGHGKKVELCTDDENWSMVMMPLLGEDIDDMWGLSTSMLETYKKVQEKDINVKDLNDFLGKVDIKEVLSPEDVKLAHKLCKKSVSRGLTKPDNVSDEEFDEVIDVTVTQNLFPLLMGLLELHDYGGSNMKEDKMLADVAEIQKRIENQKKSDANNK